MSQQNKTFENILEQGGNSDDIPPGEAPQNNTDKMNKKPILNINTTVSNKGQLDGTCYRTICDNTPALYWNKSTKKHYCVACAEMINDAIRGEAYALYGAELCQLDESLQEDDIKMYEKETGTKYPNSPQGLEMSKASLDYQEKLNQFSIGYKSPNFLNYMETKYGSEDKDSATKAQTRDADKVVPVTSKVLTGRNDPCSCNSGKKYKKCCINN